MSKKAEVSRKELLQRWSVIEQEDDDAAVHPIKRRRLRQLKEQWLLLLPPAPFPPFRSADNQWSRVGCLDFGETMFLLIFFLLTFDS